MKLATKVQRNSSIELLRILCMLQVIFLHVCNHGGYTAIGRKMGGETELIYWIVMFMSRCPVYVFIIISGYFSCTGKNMFPIKKVTTSYLPMLFYSVSIPLVIYFADLGKVSDVMWGRAAFPFLSRTWYFMTLYIIILLLSPFLNKIIQSISRKEYLYLLGIMFFILCVWQFVAHIPRVEDVIRTDNIFATEHGKSIYDFIFMYFLGGFLRLHKFFEKPLNPVWYALAFLACGMINVGITYLLPKGYKSCLLYNDNPFTVIQCVCLFEFFNHFQFVSKPINIISGCNIGIYMIHEHPLTRAIIWKYLGITDRSFFQTNYYLLQILGIILIIFVGSGLIEYARQWLFKGCSKLSLLWKEPPQKPQSE